MEQLSDQELWTIAYPEGTGWRDAFSVSESLNTLFPLRAKNGRQTPVTAEFIWKD